MAYAIFFCCSWLLVRPNDRSGLPLTERNIRKQVTYPLIADQSRIHFLNSLRPFSQGSLSSFPFAYTSNATFLESLTAEMSASPTRKMNEFTLEKRLVTDYIAFHAVNRHNASAKFLIFRPFETGLGDHVHRLMISYYLAVVSNRVFLIDWQRPFPIENFLQTANPSTDFFVRESDTALFNAADSKKMRKNTHSTAKTNTVERRPAKMTTANKVPPKQSKIPVIDDMVNAKEITVKVLTSNSPAFRVLVSTMRSAVSSTMLADLAQATISDLKPRFVARFVNEAHCRRAIMTKVLRLSDAVMEELDIRGGMLGLSPTLGKTITSTRQNKEKNKKNKKKNIVGWKKYYGSVEVKRRPYIGVHIRLGKGVGERGQRFARSSKDFRIPARCLASRAVRLAFMVGDPALPIFLATDTPSVRHEFEQAVKDAAHGRVDVVFGQWSAVHSSRSRYAALQGMEERKWGNVSSQNGGSGDNGSTDAWKGMWDSFVDVGLLGHAQHVVALYSSFARMAFAVGTTDSVIELRNEVCLDTERWV